MANTSYYILAGMMLYYVATLLTESAAQQASGSGGGGAAQQEVCVWLGQLSAGHVLPANHPEWQQLRTQVQRRQVRVPPRQGVK